MNKVIILAAGKGTRMNANIPKALVKINDKPMIEYLIKSVISSGVDKRPIIVASPLGRNFIEKDLSFYDFDIAIQEEALGTGHAVLCTKDLIGEEVDNIIVLYGDHPFIKKDSIKNLLKNHKNDVSMMVVELKDFNDWRKNFYHWGRIVKNEKGEIEGIVEFKDASEEEKEIKNVNPAIFCFNKNWLFENINKIRNNNNQKEYYLTDLIKLAFEQNIKINFSLIDAKEAVGVNSPEELEIARSLAV
ncbi:MAG: sugar phosphate nucleotidyltransferase [Patescibacteria group bacterium]